MCRDLVTPKAANHEPAGINSKISINIGLHIQPSLDGVTQQLYLRHECHDSKIRERCLTFLMAVLLSCNPK